MNTSRWRKIYDDALETDDGTLDTAFALQLFLIHELYPLGIPLAYMWFGSNAVHCMLLLTPFEILSRCLAVLAIIGGYQYKLSFPGEMIAIIFFLTFRAICIGTLTPFLTSNSPLYTNSTNSTH